MAIQALELKQNPDDPNLRYLQFTRQYDPNQGALGYPEQYFLTPEQFGQFQSAGLRPTVTRDPLLYQKGQFDPTRFAQYARGSEGDINRIAASYAQLTPSGVDLATNLRARQDWLDRAMGGSKNVLIPGSEAQKNVEALKQAQNDSVSASGFQIPKDIYSNMPVGIQLRPGLNEKQKQSIINLVSNKPENQWTAEDKKNYDFATKLKLGQTGETVWTTQKFPIQQNEKILVGAPSAGATPPSPVSGGAPTVTQHPSAPAGWGVGADGNFVKIGTPPKDLTDTSVLPDFIKNSDVFKALSPQNQGLVAVQWNGIQATSALDKIRINEALKEAAKLADPLFKQSILLAKDTLERNLKDILATNSEAKEKLEMELSIMKEDFVTKSSRLNVAQREAALKDLETISIVKDQAIREGESREASVAADVRRINRRIEAINEDLKSGRGNIAIEEQAQLARYLKDYQRTLQTTQEQAVDAGMGFSSIRSEAEKRLAEDLQDVSESTRRQKARELRSLENQAGELVATQADIDRKNKEMRVDLAKQMEQKLGYSAVPDDIRKYLPGPTIINKEGTVLGGEAERVQQERARELQQKEEDIKTSTKRAEADAQRQRQILEREREKSVKEQKRKAEEVLGSEKAQEILPGGPAPLGGITGTLKQQQAENIQRIGKSLFDTGFTPEEVKK